MSKLYYQVGVGILTLTTLFYAWQYGKLNKSELICVDNTNYAYLDSIEQDNAELKKVVNLYHHVMADELEYNTSFFDTTAEMDAFDDLCCYYEEKGVDYFEIIFNINENRK